MTRPRWAVRPRKKTDIDATYRGAGLKENGLNSLKPFSAQRKRRIVRAALAQLKPEQRELIEIAFFGGLTHDEIAAKLNLPLGTVKSRIRTGMLKLRELLSA